MLFNSFAFLVFMPLVFIGHWYVFNRTLRAQNLFIIVCSYVFYGWWDWRYLVLLFGSSFIDFLLALFIDRTDDPRKRKRALLLSIVFNLGVLCTFKYFNFFVDSFATLLDGFGLQANVWTLRILLPVGISFYTFQSLGYTIEAYRRNFKPVRDPLAYLAFVSFFPHMVAGPIMRANDLLPQFLRVRTFDLAKARDGARQVLWGLFKKIVIADSCAPIVNHIFNGDAAGTPGITLFFGAFFFAFQIYGDFSGYSDIAIGIARFLGIDLMRNFNYPYFSRSIGEFWRRWHISLSTWFRDFLYIPLGGGRGSMPQRVRNLLITFTVSGLWHGANWTFVSWGALNGAYYIPEVLRGGKRTTEVPMPRDLPRMLLTFLLVVVAWVFFRSASIAGAWRHLCYMVGNAGHHPAAGLVWLQKSQFVFILLLLAIEWRARRLQHPLEHLAVHRPLRWCLYLVITLVILLHVDLVMPNEFIYFQF